MKVKDFITGLFILLAVGAMLTSCKKEVEDCNCGTVIDSRKSDVYVHIDITIEDIKKTSNYIYDIIYETGIKSGNRNTRQSERFAPIFFFNF